MENKLEGLWDIHGTQLKEGDYLAFPDYIHKFPYGHRYQLLWDIEDYCYGIFFIAEDGRSINAFKPSMAKFMEIISDNKTVAEK